MAALHKLSRLSKSLLSKNLFIRDDTLVKEFRTAAQSTKPQRSLLKPSLIGATIGTAIGIGYAFYIIEEQRKNLALEGTQVQNDILKYRPPIEPSRKITSPVDATGLKLTLFQYQSCPFCCKVRTFLDYYGISYDVVEVGPVLKREISWSSYRKVPILLSKVEGGYCPLNDSSMIVSVLASHLHDPNYKLNELATFYPAIVLTDDKKNVKHDIINKYFLMYQGSVPKNRTLDDIIEERKWRQWADEVLIHTLSPNVYRTLAESYQTFNWFSEVGRWPEYFPAWERGIIINIGAWAMWIIGKRLKKRHNLSDDVRQSFYDELNTWLDAVKARGGQFMGKDNPDLSDLAVYGVLKSIEGCDAFKDALKHTNLATWYQAMANHVNNHRGAALITN